MQWEQSEVFLLLHCITYCVVPVLSLIILVPHGPAEKGNVTVPATFPPGRAEEKRWQWWEAGKSNTDIWVGLFSQLEKVPRVKISYRQRLSYGDAERKVLGHS